MQVTIADLTGKESGEIAITAAEGGIGYWSQIQPDPGYKYTRWMPDNPDGSLGDAIEVPDDFVFYRIAPLNDDEDGYDEDKTIEVTPALIKRGFEVGYNAPRDKGGWMVQALVAGTSREDWTSEIDSEGADMLIQFGAFGELVWG